MWDAYQIYKYPKRQKEKLRVLIEKVEQEFVFYSSINDFHERALLN